MKNYDTASEAVNDLVTRGYITNFNIDINKECLTCHKPSLSLSPEDFAIDEVYRFEGNTDPGDEMIVFAVSSKKYSVKGIVVNAFGTYSDTATSKIVQHLKLHVN